MPRERRSRKGRGMGGEPMRLDAERGNPSGVRSGVECLASARYESWLHHSRRHIYHCNPSRGFTLAGSFRRARARAVGHADRCYRGLGVLAVTRLRVDARERWFEVSGGSVATVPGPRQGNGSRKPRQGVRRLGRDTITCRLDRCVWSSARVIMNRTKASWVEAEVRFNPRASRTTLVRAPWETTISRFGDLREGRMRDMGRQRWRMLGEALPAERRGGHAANSPRTPKK